MNCKKIRQLLLSYLDNEVSPKEREAIEAHLSVCSGCRNELETLAETQRQLRQGLTVIAARASSSPHVWSAIKARLGRQHERTVPILGAVKSRVRGVAAGLMSRPAWQKSLAYQLAIVLVAGLCLGIPALLGQSATHSPGLSELNRFASYEELQEFLRTNRQTISTDYDYTWGLLGIASRDMLSSEDFGTNGAVIPEFSPTNIQVQGVDEADIVKTDGKFIYLVSGMKVFIVEAYPPEEAHVLSEIELNQRPEGIFINGDRLIILQYEGGPQTFVRIYDIADRGKPSLAREVSVDGGYFGSRMVGNYAYIVITQPAYEYNDKVVLPKINLDGTTREIPATDIYYFDVADNYYAFTTVMAINTQKDDEEPSYETILLGAASNLYVSLKNIYIAVSSPQYYGSDTETTSIHRIRIEDGDIDYEASGEVPGRVLNQFSMDEYEGFFRVATTTGYDFRIWPEWPSAAYQNHLYVLDMNLDIVGKLEGLAPGEKIYSARFMGKRCYLVTFKKVDPFFVIDLSDGYNPKVLGYLKITGYSDYLHPYDENHIIGIGKETVAAEQGDFAWYQGVKISIFDVTDVSNPKEVAKYEIGARGTDSPVLEDHKALLFDKGKNLLVMPVSVVESSYGPVWQGAYVFNISLDEGLLLRGRITHYESDAGMSGGSYYSYSPYSVKRCLYIGDVLYTISDKKIKMNNLETLDYINEVTVG